MNLRFIIVAIVTFIFLQIETTCDVYESLSVAAFIYFILKFLDELGNKLVILDVVVLTAIFLCLVMPIAGYHHFNATNRLARVWTFHMRVPSVTYYSYMIPATTTLIIGLKIPIFFRKKTYAIHKQYMVNAKAYLADMNKQGFILVGIGLFAAFVQPYAPAVLSFIFLLLRYLMFVGAFYCLYSKIPNKSLILIVVFSLMILKSISGGMFGEMVFMGSMTVILLILGFKMKYWAKFAVFVIGVCGILLIQGIKPAFRKQTWFGRNQTNKVYIFANVFTDKLLHPASMFNNEQILFLSYNRFNEGQVVSRVMNAVPARFPYANGETIFLSLAASVVPRVLWPDKPEAGGAANFERFVGIKLKGYSIGLSPFGEAYGNFGTVGGIVFMLFFGLMFNFFFHWLLNISLVKPTLILWFPFLFFYAIQIESDVVTMVNSFTKAAIFTYVLYKVFPVIFNMKL